MNQSGSEKLEAEERLLKIILSTRRTIDSIDRILPDDIEKWNKDTTKRVLEKAMDLGAITTKRVKKKGEIEFEQEKIKQQIKALKQLKDRNQFDLFRDRRVKNTRRQLMKLQIENADVIGRIEGRLRRGGLDGEERAEWENFALRRRQLKERVQNKLETLKILLIDDDQTQKGESDFRDSDGVAPAKKTSESVKLTQDDVLEYVVLVAEGQEFKVPKKKLMENSGFFMAMFSNDYLESNMSELPQPDKTAADIEVFLKLLDQEDCLSEENIFSAVEVACFYQAKGIMDVCEKWLENDTNFDKNDKFQLADHYNLESLKTTVLDTISTVLGIQEILPENIDVWTKDTMTLVLQKILGFFGIPRSTEKRTVREVKAEQEIFQLQIEAFQKKIKENSRILKDYEMIVHRRNGVSQLLIAKRNDVARLEEILRADDLDDRHRQGLEQKLEESKQNADGLQKELDELDFPQRID